MKSTLSHGCLSLGRDSMTASDIARTSVRVHLRWADLDSLGHLYHAKAVELLDEARAAWVSEFVSCDAGESHVIARLDISYLGEVLRTDRWLDVSIEVERVGSSSLVLHETVRNAVRDAVIECHSTLVLWDSASHRSRLITDQERDRLETQ